MAAIHSDLFADVGRNQQILSDVLGRWRPAGDAWS
jgi:hypothetical protein